MIDDFLFIHTVEIYTTLYDKSYNDHIVPLIYSINTFQTENYDFDNDLSNFNMSRTKSKSIFFYTA